MILTNVPTGANSGLVRLSLTRTPSWAHGCVRSNGGFSYFGPLLYWCAPQSPHAYAVLPEYHCVPAAGEVDRLAWAKTGECEKTSGQMRELSCIDGDDICYAGTFLCHAGPSIRITEPVHEVCFSR